MQDRLLLEFFESEFKGHAWMTRGYLEARIYGPRRTCPVCGGRLKFTEGLDPASDALYRCEACDRNGEAGRLVEDFRYPWAQRTLDAVLVRVVRSGRLERIETRRAPVYTLHKNLRRFPAMATQLRTTVAWGRMAVYVPVRTLEGVKPLRIGFGEQFPHELGWQCLDAYGRTRPYSSKPVGRAFVSSVPRAISSQLQYRVKEYWMD